MKLEIKCENTYEQRQAKGKNNTSFPSSFLKIENSEYDFVVNEFQNGKTKHVEAPRRRSEPKTFVLNYYNVLHSNCSKRLL